jgi:tetratricopeptide (TPR) repeat protein
LAYAEGKLNAEERYQVEKHLTDCELCSDALEGLSLLKDKTKLPKLVAGINVAIDNRVNKKEGRLFRFDFRMRLAVAALIIIVLGFTFLFKYVFQEQKKDMMAQRMLKDADITKEEKKPLEKHIDSTSSVEHESKIGGDLEKPKQHITTMDAEKIPGTGGESVVGTEKDMPLITTKAEVSNEGLAADQQQKDESGYFRSLGEKTIVTDTSKDLLEKKDEDKYNSNSFSFAQNYKNATGENYRKEAADSTVVPVGTVIESNTQNQIALNKSVTLSPATNASYAYNTEVDGKEEQTKSKADKKSGKMAKTVPPASANTTVVASDYLRGAEDTRYYKAIQEYNNNDYTGSKDLLESYLKDEPTDFNALYYCGVSYYYLNQYDNAITSLEKAIKFKSNNFIETAQWYLALSYIGKKENNKADTLLNAIIKAKGSFKDQAEKKLLELK